MIHETLLDIGFADKEAIIYMTLLRYGSQPTSFLAHKAGLNRGTAYVILHNLLSKGLIVKTTKQKVQYFSALQPTQLIHYLDHKEKELKNHKEKVNNMMGDFLGLINPMMVKPKFEFFDGPEGALAVLNSALTSTDKNLRAFLSIVDLCEFIGERYFNEHTNTRIEKGFTLQAIRTIEQDNIAFANDPNTLRYISNAAEGREIRYASGSLAFPVTMYMYDNKLAIISSKEENFAMLIESKELASMQKKLFELLWKSLEPKIKIKKPSKASK